MNAYTLDFSRPVPSRVRACPIRRPRQRVYRVYYTLRRMLVLFSGLVCGIALIGLMQQRTQTQLLRERYQNQTIRYDSLLAAKVGADRQLEELRIRLIEYHIP